jgi:hypothetical protein
MRFYDKHDVSGVGCTPFYVIDFHYIVRNVLLFISIAVQAIRRECLISGQCVDQRTGVVGYSTLSGVEHKG